MSNLIIETAFDLIYFFNSISFDICLEKSDSIIEEDIPPER